jgi:hypothetical protein
MDLTDQRRLQVDQRAQPVVLGGERVDAGRLGRLRGQSASSGAAQLGLGRVQAAHVLAAGMRELHRHRERALQRQQQHLQARAQRARDREAGVGRHQEQRHRGEHRQARQCGRALVEERRRTAVQGTERHGVLKAPRQQPRRGTKEGRCDQRDYRKPRFR